MRLRPSVLPIAALMLVFVLMTLPQAVAQTSLAVPQSIRHQHEQVINRLSAFAKDEGPVGAAASKALTFLKAHYAKEEQFVLPPLGLLSRIANGEISKDMEPAIAMADRTRAALPELQKDHIQITSLMSELIEAGRSTGNNELLTLATRIASQSLNDMEVAQPTTIMIGNYVRERLSKSR